MKKFLRFVLVIALSTGALFAARDIGEISVPYNNTMIKVRVTGNTAELDGLAKLAFSSHGRYFLADGGHAYDIRFSAMGANQVRVDVAKGGQTVSSGVANGKTLRQALLRAADMAVDKTNGQGLRGFFSARLAFVGEATGKKEIYTADLFLGEAQRITNNRSLVLKPRWSPDGSRLVYTSFYKSGAPDIIQYDFSSFQQNILVEYKGTNMGPRYSPNGQQIAMVLTGEGAQEIYVRPASGGKPVRRTHSEAVKSSPAWSPDGSQIVFEMQPGPQLYIMPASGGAPRRLSSVFGYMSEPDWSPVSNQIACTIRVPGDRFQIAVCDVSGSAKQVSKAAFDGIEPSWLADGRHLVYTARDRTRSILCILDTETGKSTSLTPATFGPAMQASVWTP
ncbi:MAG TPA: biopolymer transporter Tol [Opitutaceae bacterium]|nr:biopolymer transporter Tol [Opitutaceae bacterium]